jgi:hypothetical protein
LKITAVDGCKGKSDNKKSEQKTSNPKQYGGRFGGNFFVLTRFSVKIIFNFCHNLRDIWFTTRFFFKKFSVMLQIVAANLQFFLLEVALKKAIKSTFVLFEAQLLYFSQIF